MTGYHEEAALERVEVLLDELRLRVRLNLIVVWTGAALLGLAILLAVSGAVGFALVGFALVAMTLLGLLANRVVIGWRLSEATSLIAQHQRGEA